MIELRNLSKQFTTIDGPVEALKHINLTVQDGDIYGIIGMSGAGKSTLVRCINMLEKPTEGSVLMDGRDMGTLSEKELRQARRQITMIFQGFNLLMQRTCLKNVMLPLRFGGTDRNAAEKKAKELLELVGLPDKANSYPAQLSGGQQQRVAIARALATEPKVLLCDEATSALDPKTTHAILDLIREINKKLGITVIVITHQMSVVQEICNRVAILARTGDLQRRHRFPGTAHRQNGGGLQHPGQHSGRFHPFCGRQGLRIHSSGYSRYTGGSCEGCQLSEQDAGCDGAG